MKIIISRKRWKLPKKNIMYKKLFSALVFKLKHW